MENKKKRFLRNEKGFTLVELIVILAILGILAAIAVPNVQNYVQNARITADVADARTIANAIKMQVNTNSNYSNFDIPATNFTGTVPAGGDVSDAEATMLNEAAAMLEDVPTPRFDTDVTSFTVIVDADDVTVQIDGVEVFPDPASPYFR